MIKNPLETEGIYYKHDESNILKGYVYICGPKDTLYFGGNYFLRLHFHMITHINRQRWSLKQMMV